MKITIVDIIGLAVILLVGYWSWQCLLGMIIGMLIGGMLVNMSYDSDKEDHSQSEQDN